MPDFRAGERVQLTVVRGRLHTALLIGHQPTLGDLVTTLAKPSALADQVARKFPTSGLAVLTYRGAWKTLSAGKATLKRFEVPRG